MQKEEDQEKVLIPGVCGTACGELGSYVQHKIKLYGRLSLLYLTVFLCVCGGQVGPVDPEEFMDAAIKGKQKVVEKYLADGGNPNFHDEVYTSCVAAKQIQFYPCYT